MKKGLLAVLIISLFLFGCGQKKMVKKDVIQVIKAEVVSAQGVLVGEFKDGAKVITGNTAENVPTWEGFKLGLRAVNGKYYEYLSRDMYYEGDGVEITVRNGEVTKVSYKP